MYWLFFPLLAIVPGVIFYALVRPGAAAEDKSSQSILMVTAIVVPLAGLVMYQQRGAFDEVALVESMQALHEGAIHGDPNVAESMEEFRGRLEAMTLAQPDKAEYWYLLGSLHAEMQDFQAAVDAYQEASRLFPDDISIHSRMAEARFLADNHLLTEAVRVHIDKVLAENPFDTTVLGVLAMSAYGVGQFATAIEFWQKSLHVLPPMSPAAQSIRSRIEQTKAAAAIKGPAGGIKNTLSDEIVDRAEGAEPSIDQAELSIDQAEPSIDQAELSTGQAELSTDQAELAIDLDVSLNAAIQAMPDTQVFVFARQFGGSPMPIAVERVTAEQLPLRIRLDDSRMMIKGQRLSDFARLELVARLSFSGQPGAKKGDYQRVVGPINPADIKGAIRLNISEMVTE